MQKRFGLVFGGIVAYILLALYAGCAIYMIAQVLKCGGDTSCTDLSFKQGLTLVVTTIGGLISALVISKLTVTKPGENPGIMKMAETPTGTNVAATGAVLFYLAVWLLVGLAALVVSVLIYPEISDTLSDLGTTWLGLAVAAGYAYFGVDPSQS